MDDIGAHTGAGEHDFCFHLRINAKAAHNERFLGYRLRSAGSFLCRGLFPARMFGSHDQYLKNGAL